MQDFPSVEEVRNRSRGLIAGTERAEPEVRKGWQEAKIIYWHRELPPLDAEAMGEHTVEATSQPVPGTLAHRDELWEQCYTDLMAQTCIRLAQEIARFGGDYAHVLDESVESRRDDVKGTAWLHGRFTYVIYRRPPTR